MTYPPHLYTVNRLFKNKFSTESFLVIHRIFTLVEKSHITERTPHIFKIGRFIFPLDFIDDTSTFPLLNHIKRFRLFIGFFLLKSDVLEVYPGLSHPG